MKNLLYSIIIHLFPAVLGSCSGAPLPPPSPEEALEQKRNVTSTFTNDEMIKMLIKVDDKIIRSTHLKREEPPSAITLSTLAAW